MIAGAEAASRSSVNAYYMVMTPSSSCLLGPALASAATITAAEVGTLSLPRSGPMAASGALRPADLCAASAKLAPELVCPPALHHPVPSWPASQNTGPAAICTMLRCTVIISCLKTSFVALARCCRDGL